jgi:hypothetical protein
MVVWSSGRARPPRLQFDGRYHEKLSSAEEAGAVIVNRQVPEQQGEEKKENCLQPKLVSLRQKYKQMIQIKAVG